MLRTLIAAAFVSLAATASAETTVGLEVLRQIETPNEKGEIEITYAPVQSAVPGEALVYRITLENKDDMPATSVGMALAVDPHVTIDPHSVASEQDEMVNFSVDGGANYAAFADLLVEREGEMVAAEPADITHMQIAIAEIAPQSQVVVEYRAAVD